MPEEKNIRDGEDVSKEELTINQGDVIQAEDISDILPITEEKLAAGMTLPKIASSKDSNATIEGLAYPTPFESYADETFSKLLSGIIEIKNDFQSLQQSFESKIKYDSSKERIIDSLHRELQTYREGLHFKIMRPLFFDLIEMHDDLTNLLKYHLNGESESDNLSKLLQSLSSFQDTIESVLERHGVIAYNETGDQFAPQRQRVLRAEITDDPTKDRLVYEHLRKGFEYEGRVLRPETVSLYKFRAPTSSEHTPEEV